MSTLRVSPKRGSMITLRPTHYIWMVIRFIVVTEGWPSWRWYCLLC